MQASRAVERLWKAADESNVILFLVGKDVMERRGIAHRSLST